MKYIFTLGISFKKYKKPLDITIRSKYLIDHLQITDNIEALDPWPWNPNAKIETLVYNIFDQVNGKHPLNQLPEKMFFYEIDEDSIGENFIIDIDANDTNYTNGFMTKFSLFNVRIVSVIPKKLIEYFFSKGKKNTRVIDKIEMRSRYPRPDAVVKKGTWPYNRFNWEYRCLITNKVLNKNNSNSTDATKYQSDAIPIWLGGKIQLKINVIKKFGIKMLDPYSSVPFMPDPDWPDWSLTAPVIQRHVNRYGPLRTNFFQYERYFKKYYDINIKNENQ